MSTASATAASGSARRSRITWTEMERGFFVAKGGGEFVGYIDTTADGRFVTFDGSSTVVGTFDTIVQAQAACDSAASTDVLEPASRARTGFVLATVTGATAVALLLASPVLLAAVGG